MRIVVDLPPQDVAFIDAYAARTGAGSRSAVLHEAVGPLRHARPEQVDSEGRGLVERLQGRRLT